MQSFIYSSSLSCFLLSPALKGLQEPIPTDTGWRQGTPWTSLRLITGPHGKSFLQRVHLSRLQTQKRPKAEGSNHNLLALLAVLLSTAPATVFMHTKQTPVLYFYRSRNEYIAAKILDSVHPDVGFVFCPLILNSYFKHISLRCSQGEYSGVGV